MFISKHYQLSTLLLVIYLDWYLHRTFQLYLCTESALLLQAHSYEHFQVNFHFNGQNSGFSTLPTDTSTCGLEELGIKPPTFQLAADLLCLLSNSHPKLKTKEKNVVELWLDSSQELSHSFSLGGKSQQQFLLQMITFLFKQHAWGFHLERKLKICILEFILKTPQLNQCSGIKQTSMYYMFGLPTQIKALKNICIYRLAPLLNSPA